VEVLPRNDGNDHVVVKDVNSAMWDVSLGGDRRAIRDANGAAITLLRASEDGKYVVTGTETGVVEVYETSSWHVIETVRALGSIRQIAFDPKNRDLLIASEAGHSQFGHLQIVALGPHRAYRWHEVAVEVRDVAYSPDGEIIGFVCKDGGTWLYALGSDVWAYTRDHDVDISTGKFSPDGRLFATTDRRGIVVVRDVASTLAAAADRP